MENRWHLFTKEIYELNLPQISVIGLKEGYQLKAGSSLSVVFYLKFQFDGLASLEPNLLDQMTPLCYFERRHPLFDVKVSEHEKGSYKVQVTVIGRYLDKNRMFKETLRIDYLGGTILLPLTIHVYVEYTYVRHKDFRYRIKKRRQPVSLDESDILLEAPVYPSKPGLMKKFWHKLSQVFQATDESFEGVVDELPTEPIKIDYKAYLETCNKLKMAYLFSQENDTDLKALIQEKKELDSIRKQCGEFIIDESSSKAMKRAQLIYKQNRQPLWLNYRNAEHIEVLVYALRKGCVTQLWLESIERLYLTLLKQEKFEYDHAKQLYLLRPCERFQKIIDDRFNQLDPLLQIHFLDYPHRYLMYPEEIDAEPLENLLYRGLLTRSEPLKTFELYEKYLEGIQVNPDVVMAMNHYFAAQILIEDLFEFPQFIPILEKAYDKSEISYPLGLALLRLYSIFGIKNTEITRKLLNKYINDGIMMSWLEPLAQDMAISYTSNQMLIDHFTSQGKRVELHYRFDEQDVFQMKSMKRVVYGMYAINLDLFAYESVDYYIKEIDERQKSQIVKSDRQQYIPKNENTTLNSSYRRREFVETLIMCEAMDDEQGLLSLIEEWIEEIDELDKIIIRM